MTLEMFILQLVSRRFAMSDIYDTTEFTCDEEVPEEAADAEPSAPVFQRHSLSQPVLPSARTASVNIASTMRTDIPIIKTLEENHELRLLAHTNKQEIRYLTHQYNEAKEALHQSVREILDEYIELKFRKEDVESERASISKIKQELLENQEYLDEAKYNLEKLRESEKEWIREKEELLARIQELENSVPPTPSDETNPIRCIDDLRAGNPDWTLFDENDVKINKLENDLFDEKVKVSKLEEQIRQLNAQIDEKLTPIEPNDSKTFTYGPSSTLDNDRVLRYNDQLESELAKEKEKYVTCQKALVEYMNRTSKLEMELKVAKSGFEISGLQGTTAEELMAEIERIRSELVDLRSENHELRSRCDALRGGDGNASNSFASPGALRTPGTRKPIPQSPLAKVSFSLDSEEKNLEERENKALQKYKSLKEQFKQIMRAQGMDSDNDSDLTAEKSGDEAPEPEISPEKSPMKPVSGDIEEIVQALNSSVLHASMSVHEVQQFQENFSNSSAALFEEILEKIGSESELAPYIQNMKLTFEQDVREQADLSRIIEATDRDLNGIVNNLTLLEKSFNPSFILDASQRYSMANTSAFLSQSFQDYRRRGDYAKEELANSAMDSLKKELVDLELKYNVQNVELESLQTQISTLKDKNADYSVKFEDLLFEKDEVEARARDLANELKALQKTVEDEISKRRKAEKEVDNKVGEINELTNEINQSERKFKARIEEMNAEVDRARQDLHQAEKEIKQARNENESLQDQCHELRHAWKRAEAAVVRSNENADELGTQVYEMGQDLQRLRDWESQEVALRQRKPSVTSPQRVEEMPMRSSPPEQRPQKEDLRVEEAQKTLSVVFEGLKEIQAHIAALTNQPVKTRLIYGDGDSAKKACEEVCMTISKEIDLHKKLTADLRAANEKLKAHSALSHEQENVAPAGNDRRPPLKSATSNIKEREPYSNPMRQLLFEAVRMSDEIVQGLKCANDLKTYDQVKGLVAEILMTTRGLRAYLHDKFILCKVEANESMLAETNEQLIQRIKLLEDEVKAKEREAREIRKKYGLQDLVPRIKKELGESLDHRTLGKAPLFWFPVKMTDYMAQMLNELMGSQRDSLPGEAKELSFDHPDVCTDFLVGFCTHDAFKNTKNDLGPCEYMIHDDNMRHRYAESSKKWRMGFEERFLDRIRRLHNEVRRKIEKNEARLQMTQGETKVAEETFEKKRDELREKKENLAKRVEMLVHEAQVEGGRGNVAAAQTAVDKADKFKAEIDELNDEEERLESEKKRAVVMEENVTAGNRQMQVCQVCGCFMLQNDAQQRIDDHLSGKLHIAYQTIQDHMAIMEKGFEERRASRANDAKRSSDRDRDRKRDRERDDRKKSDRSRSRDKDRSRRGGGGDDRSDRDRDRRRDGDRDRNRDSGRNRDRHNDRDRDRNRRDRDRRH
ncbi:unnamed protein product [Caenorhabditis auriculariae]|uniref:Uncharacterized protein n=1 Tax=Caenorhabditis auriculariae TaxID=2777116 RepID=A0A8S1GT37_9PELO|nr:unnamed protein product [Caenorhabditis auriculariae]